MFGLIPLVATLVLAATVILANAFIGGDIFGGGSAKADAQRVISEAEHIVAAIEMYKLTQGTLPDDGSGNLDLNAIVTDPYYYKGNSTNWIYNGNAVATTFPKEKACLLVNERQGYSSATVPDCSALPAALQGASYYCCNTP